MVESDDPDASSGHFISTFRFLLAPATFVVDVPVSGAYAIWWRALARQPSAYPFIVVIDDEPMDVFHAVGVTWTNAWRWARVGGTFRFAVSDANGSTPDLTVVPLAAGPHKIALWGLDPAMLVDELLITNDRDFAPTLPALTVPGSQSIDELATLV